MKIFTFRKKWLSETFENESKLITAGGEINMDGPGEKHVTATGRPMNQSAKIAAMQNGNYELFDWRQSNQSLNQEIIEIKILV